MKSLTFFILLSGNVYERSTLKIRVKFCQIENKINHLKIVARRARLSPHFVGRLAGRGRVYNLDLFLSGTKVVLPAYDTQARSILPKRIRRHPQIGNQVATIIVPKTKCHFARVMTRPGNTSRVDSGRVRRFSKCCALDRVGSGRVGPP